VRSKVLWLVITLLVFAPSLGTGFVWDDHQLIEDDTRIHTMPSLGELLRMPFFPEETKASESAIDPGNARYYRPLLKLVHAVQYQQLGPAPFGYHLFNLLVHAGNVLLALVWLKRRLGDGPWVPLAAALGVIPFALHPSRVLATTWVSGGGDLLLGSFVLLALIIWQGRTLGAGAIALLALCSAGATLSKEAGIVLFVALLADTLLLAPRNEWRKRFGVVALLAALQIALLVLRAQMIGIHGRGPFADGLFALLSRISVSFGFELKAAVLPTELRHQLNYTLGNPSSLPGLLQVMGVVGLLAGLLLIAFLVGARFRSAWRPAAADLALFAVLLVPGLNLVTIGSQGGTLSERYLYVPMLGISALCTRGIARWASVRGRNVVLAVGSLWAVGYAALCVVEISYLQSDRTLYTRFVQQSPTELSSVDGLLRAAVVQGDHALARSCNTHRLCVIANGLAGRMKKPASVRGLISALLSYADIELHLASDVEQDQLLNVRGALDALAQGKAVALVVDGKTIGLDSPAPLSTWPSPEVERLQLLRAIAHARTLQLEQAGALLTPLVQDSASAREAKLWNERVANGLLAPPNDCADPDHVLASALAIARAGLPVLARTRLGECSALPASAAQLVAAEIDLSDRRPDLAKARLFPLAPNARSLEPRLQQDLGRLARHTEAMLAAQAQHAAVENVCLPCDRLMTH